MAEKRKFSDGKTFGRPKFRTKKNPKVFLGHTEYFYEWNLQIICRFYMEILESLFSLVV